MTATETLPRGVRNNNPGNLRHGDPWEGLAPEQPDREFCTFVDAQHGIRALMMVLLTYQDVHGLRSVRGMIYRWAPPSENATNTYLAFVAGQMGVDPDAKIDMHDAATAFRMVRAIIAEECARYRYPESVLAAGIAMAGIGSPAAGMPSVESQGALSITGETQTPLSIADAAK